MKENEYIPDAIKQVFSLCFAIPLTIVIIVCLWIKKKIGENVRLGNKL